MDDTDLRAEADRLASDDNATVEELLALREKIHARFPSPDQRMQEFLAVSNACRGCACDAGAPEHICGGGS